MKSAILIIACCSCIFLSKAQQQPAPKAPATQRAIHQLETLQQRVDLNQDQAITVNSILLSENICLDSLSDHPTGDEKRDGQIRHQIYHDADVRIYSCLNESQQVQYVLWKQEQRIKNLEKKQAALLAATRQVTDTSFKQPRK
jgi:hypothetical protein